MAVFDHHSQDSGNLSWLVTTDQGDLFVKTAGTPGPPPADAPIPYFGHNDRCQLLRNAVELARSCDHPRLARLRNVIESPLGPVLVYGRAPGELIGTTSLARPDPHSAYQRFAHLPAEQLLATFDDLIELHHALAWAGWVAGDLYDGCLILDFTTGQLTVIDLDSYHRGSSINTMGRMFGSPRFMAPEEFELGATIDQRTTVYTLGRLAWHFGTRISEQAEQFCGPHEVRAVLEQALQAERSKRFATFDDFVAAWKAARG
jgi:serine/threonine-protein kinase